MKAIQTLALTKNFGTFEAVRDVNLSVNQGEIFGLLGPNGAGKSTLVKMLVGLVNPSAGSARVFGLSFRELAARRHIGYLPELFRFPPWLTADEVISYHQRLLKVPVDAEERAQLLEKVGLKGREGDRVRSFSKGLQQRLGLAVAMVGRPELIFLDEPTSALDPIGRHEVSQILGDLRESGVTIFLNSHLLSDVEKLSDAVALIDRGGILYQGSLDEAIYGSARGYRVHLGKLTEEAARTLLAAFPGSVIQWGKGADPAVLSATLMREILPRLVSSCVSVGAEVYEVVPDHSSLEDWFLARVGKDGRCMGTVARYSLKETLRKRLLVAAGGLTGLFLLLFFLFLKWVGLPANVPGATYIAGLTYLDLGLFAAYVMIALFAVLIFVASISGEIDDGTLLAIVPRPIRRFEIILGKWTGLSLITLVYASLLFWGVVVIDQAQFGGVAGGFANLLAAYGDFLLEGLLVGTVTLLGSVLAATMTNGIVVSSAVLIAFLGGALQQLGALTNPAPAFSVIGWVTSLLIPTDALYRRALYQILGNHVYPGAVELFGPFGAVHPPGEGMVFYALVYTAGMLMLAIWRFGVKDL